MPDFREGIAMPFRILIPFIAIVLFAGPALAETKTVKSSKSNTSDRISKGGGGGAGAPLAKPKQKMLNPQPEPPGVAKQK
jgi:hypothetical protein